MDGTLEIQKLLTVLDVDGQRLERNMQAAFDKSERKAKDSTDKINSTLASIGSGVGKGASMALRALSGDFGDVIDLATGLTSAGLKLLPVVGPGLSAAFDQTSGAMLSAIDKGFTYNDMMRRQSISMTALTGDAKLTRTELEQLSAVTSKTEFGKTSIFGAAREMQNMGREAKMLPADLLGMAAASSALSASTEEAQARLSGMASAFAKVLEMGKVGSRDVRRLVGSGIPVFDILAEQLGVSKKRAEQLVNHEVIDADDFITALTSGMATRFGTASQEMLQLLDVQQRKLSGGMAALQGKAFKGAYDATVTGLGGVNQLIRSDAANSIAATLNTQISPVTDLIQSTIKAMESGDLTGGALKVGQSLIHGVESGILEKGKDVAGAGVKVIQGAITDIRDTFGIHSPCDVTDEKIGVPIAQGIQAGFIRTLTDTSAMDGALDQFVHHVQGKLTSAQAKAYEALSKLVERESGFMPKLIQMSKQRGLNPDDLLNVMAIESSFNPKAHNKFGYTGLMQMGTKEAINAGTTTSAMLQMSGTQQLDYMFRYLDQRLAPLVKANAHIGLAELYATVGHGSATLNPDATFWSKGSKGYANNPLWDFNKDGRIQQWEFGPAAQTKLGAGSVFTVNGSGAVTASNPMPVRVVAVMNSAPEAARGPGPSAAGYFNQAVPGLLAYKTLGEEAKELGGDWDATNSILKDTGQIVLEVKSDTELLTTSTNNLGTSVQQIPLIPLVGEFKQVDAAITKNVANVDNLRKKYGTFSGEVLQGLKKNLKDLPTGREVVTKFVIDLPHNITDELSHAMDVGAQQGIGAALRTAGLDFAQLIKQAAFQEIEKVLTEEFIKLISWLGLSVVSDDANSTATTANTAAVTALTSAVATLTGVMASTGGGSKGGGFLDLFGSLFEGSGSVGSFGPDAFYGLATGGDFTGGGPLLVGEHGPELLFPKQPGYVMSNSDVRESLSSSKQGQPQTVNVYVNVKPDAQHRVRSSSQIAVEVYQGSAAARRNM